MSESARTLTNFLELANNEDRYIVCKLGSDPRLASRSGKNRHSKRTDDAVCLDYVWHALQLKNIVQWTLTEDTKAITGVKIPLDLPGGSEETCSTRTCIHEYRRRWRHDHNVVTVRVLRSLLLEPELIIILYFPERVYVYADRHSG